jgi:hypothetical protein
MNVAHARQKKNSVEFLGVQELIYEAPCGRWKVPMQGSNTWGMFDSGGCKVFGYRSACITIVISVQS